MSDANRIGVGSPSGRASAANDQSNDDRAGRTFDDAKKIGGELLSAARDSVVGLLDEQRARAATQIAVIGDALRRSTETLDQESGLPTLGQYAGEAARQVDDLAEAVRSRSWSELAGDAEDFARRWPAIYLAAAIGLGFFGGRLLLSAAPRREAQRDETAGAMREGHGGLQDGARYDHGAVAGGRTVDGH